MKQLVLLQGEPGCGKTTYVKDLGLENYCISPDSIRLQFSSPVWSAETQERVVPQKDNNKVWKALFSILEHRMSNGDFTIVDATHGTLKQVKQYKHLAELYGYRIYLVNLSNEDVDVSVVQNERRPKMDKVPVEVVNRMHKSIKEMKIPGYITELPKKNQLQELEWKTLDLNNYKVINIVGDIHGCYSVLEASKIFKYENIVNNPDNFFIFLGDYFDRGIENHLVFNYLDKIKDLPNVVLLEGNHERYLRKYARSEKDFNMMTKKEVKSYYRSTAFIETTLRDFMNHGIDKKQVNKLNRKLQQCLVFGYGGIRHTCTHGGILPGMVNELNKVSTSQLIKGVGSYDTDIDSLWDNLTISEVQFHGHRNTFAHTNKDTKSYNLEQGVEKGGTLSTVSIWKMGNKVKYSPKETKNEVYHTSQNIKNQDIDKYVTQTPIEQYIESCISSDDIKVSQQYGNVYSLNFTKKAFNKGRWDNLTITARGMFVRYDGQDSYILGRGYNKFFNLGERENKEEKLVDKLEEPIGVFKKENGFLGLIYLDPNIDKLVFCSKSMTHLNGSEHAKLFKDLVDKKYSESKDKIYDLLTNKYKGYTMVFEVIDPENDPHIIKEPEPKIVLLDIIENTLEGKRLPLEKVYNASKYANVPCKKFLGTVQSKNLFDASLQNSDITHEGFVLEDANGYQIKYKSEYYNTWKYLRTLVGKLFKGVEIDFEKLGGEEFEFMLWVEDNKEELYKYKDNIAKLREIYYEQGK